MITAAGPLRCVTPGTLIPVISLLPAFGVLPQKVWPNHAILFEVLPTNQGFTYIGNSVMSRAAMTGIYAWLPIPTENFAPSFQAALTIAPNGMSLNDFWFDADNTDDGVIVTYLVL